MRTRRPYGVTKRLADVFAALVLLVVTMPVQVGVGVAVLFKLGRPVLFRQTRAGLRGQPFSLLKFRSMKNAAGSGAQAADADRLTPFGQRLREWSLDELPGLWNVLRGDMSMVGPRPLLMEYLPRYSRDQGRRHEVRPGLTGLAQVSGRNEITWDERLRLDVVYVDTYSPALDLKIVGRTLAVVAKRRGIKHDGHATMPKFGEDHAE